MAALCYEASERDCVWGEAERGQRFISGLQRGHGIMGLISPVAFVASDIPVDYKAERKSVM